MDTNTGIGIGIGIPFRNSALGGDNIYFPPELKARMIGVWDNYGKKNTDADRNIIKNKIPNAGGDLEILNAAYEGMSGCNGYPVVFGANETWENLSSVYSYTSDVTSTTIHISRVKNAGTGLLFSYVKKDGALTNIREIPAFRVTVKGLEGNSKFGYRYLATEDATVETLVYLGNGTHELSKSFAPTEALLDLTRNAWVGIFITPMVEGEVVFDCDITIEVLPEYEGAFVTDGVNDMIISQKTIAEMGITNEVTIVSMIHQITLNSTYGNGFTNYIENLDKSTYVRNNIYKAGKTGIYGYSVSLINGTGSNINNILGDKNDYGFEVVNRQNTLNASKLSIIGRATGFNEISSIAHYWTFAVLGKATADEINLIIAKYNLDRTLRPDILCNITKQGITNDNHADFNDKLIDYSGNGRDIQMYNLLWKGGSGIGASDKRPPFLKPVNFSIPGWNTEANEVRVNYEPIDYGVKITKIKTDGTALFWVSAPNHIDNIAWYKVSGVSTGKGIRFGAETRNSTWTVIAETDGIYKVDWTNLVDSTGNRTLPCILSNGWIGDCNIIIEQIDPCLNGLCLDGITDFGKVIGMPIYKDYTFIIDRQIITNDDSGGIVASKSESSTDVAKQGAFIFEYLSTNAISTWSYYKNNSLVANSDSNRNISYQSKYSYNGKEIEIGEAKDSDKLWIGTIRDNDERFANVAIYSLMSFPYSMSEFLIERQLKKHKLGTLYPDMVEFRPVIKKDDRIKSIKYYIDSKTANIGQYYPIGTGLGIAVETVQPYMVKSLKVNRVNTIPNADYKGFNARLDSKSPQKITMDIQVDTNLIQWNPIITSTAELTTAPTFAIRGTSTLLKPGDWIPKNSEIWVIVTMNNLIDELRKFSLNDTFINIPSSSYNPDTGKYGFPFVIDNESPQNINLTIDEYIRYEDIVQPYPVLLRFNNENGNEVSWGGKFRVGSTITRIGSAADSNLLPNIYNIFGLLLNDNQVTSSKVIVEKTMVFKAKSAYIFDNNEPNCILSPRLLRIPNSSYKILGYIPDISGHGNHGVIHNSAYAEGSGVNEDGSYQFDGVNDHVTIPTVTGGGKQVLIKVNNNTINSILYDQRSSGASPNSLYSDFAIYNTNTVDNNLIAYQSRLVGKTYIDGILNTNITCEDLLGVLHNITITCDIVTPNNGVVPNIGRGGVLKDLYSKVALYDFMLFDDISTDDKIKELNEYVGIEAKVELPPYYWDAYGKTNLDVDRGIVPQLGIAKDYSFASFDNEMAWYLIPNDNYINVVSRNGYEITLKNLSTGVNGWRFQNSTVKGFISHDIPFRIKANKSIRVYWDMHSYKVSTGAEFGEVISITNVSPNKDTYINLRHLTEEELAKLDTNKDRMYYLLWFDLSTIAVNEEVVIEMLPVEGGRNLWLNNYNFAYDKMSGFGGYEFDKFTNTSRWIETKRENGIEVIEKNDYSFTAKRVGTGEYFWDFKNNSIRTLDKELTVKAVSNNNVSIRWEFKYRTAEKPDIDSAIVLVKQAMTPNVPITVTLPYKTTEEQIELGVIEGSTYYLFYFDPTDIPVNREYTVEMLPLYPNGLVYDAVTDYSKNSNIPALDDFTAIMKRKWLKKQGCPLIKGSKVYEGGNGNALLFEWDKAYNFVFYKRTDIIEGELPDNISFITPTNYNGNVITRGSEQDTNGICIAGDGNAGFANMVFYKLILYPKTIPLLQINFLKNLMERDEIIDLDNPIFKK